MNFEHPTPRGNLRHKNKIWGKQNDTHALQKRHTHKKSVRRIAHSSPTTKITAQRFVPRIYMSFIAQLP